MRIFTEKKYKAMLDSFADKFIKLHYRLMRIYLTPMLIDLKELRKNTWDKDRIDIVIEWINLYIDKQD